MGPAGAGKSLQAQLLVDKNGYEWISTGHLLREAFADKEVKKKMNAGALIDDALVQDIVAKAIKKAEHPEKVLLDGFPRNVDQVKWLMDHIEELGTEVKCVLGVEISNDVAKDRLMNRGREDDSAEAIDERHQLYLNETKPIIDYLREQGVNICPVEGDATVDQVHENIASALQEQGLDVHEG